MGRSLIIRNSQFAIRNFSDSLRPDNGGVSGKSYCVSLMIFADTVRFPTPQSIHALRCCVLRTRWTLSEARFERYYSGSQLL